MGPCCGKFIKLTSLRFIIFSTNILPFSHFIIHLVFLIQWIDTLGQIYYEMLAERAQKDLNLTICHSENYSSGTSLHLFPINTVIITKIMVQCQTQYNDDDNVSNFVRLFGSATTTGGYTFFWCLPAWFTSHYTHD